MGWVDWVTPWVGMEVTSAHMRVGRINGGLAWGGMACGTYEYAFFSSHSQH